MKLLQRLNDHWAIGRLDDPPQWTLARRRMQKGREDWISISFCQTSPALRVAVNEKVVRGADFYPGSAKNTPITEEARQWLADLPPRIES